MTKPQIAEGPGPASNIETRACEALTMGLVVFGIDFKFKRRERVYDADKVWSGEHSVRDFTEM